MTRLTQATVSLWMLGGAKLLNTLKRVKRKFRSGGYADEIT